MGWRLSATFEGVEDGASANYPDFRIFRSERSHSHEAQEDCIARWTPCTPETAATCSAVSFYFAQKLHRELGIPIGVVLQPYAGTPIAAYDLEVAKKQLAKDFPFYFVQLPSWFPAQTVPVEADAAWAVSREMMRLVARSIPNTGVAVSIDTGDDILLHPKDKKPIGLRLAYLALKKTYNVDFVEYGPFYKSHRVEGDKIVLTFDSVG